MEEKNLFCVANPFFTLLLSETKFFKSFGLSPIQNVSEKHDFQIHLYERLNPFCGQNFSSERSSERFSLRQRQVAVWLEILKSINPGDFQQQTAI